MNVPGPTTLACKDVVELVTEFLGNSLAPEDRARIEQHLLVCPPCTAHFEQMKTTVELTAALREPSSTGADERLLALFRQWRQK
jgi:anti-sigma factor RsiW